MICSRSSIECSRLVERFNFVFNFVRGHRENVTSVVGFVCLCTVQEAMEVNLAAIDADNAIVNYTG